MSDRIAVMDAGHIVQFGRPTEIYRHPESRFVASFVGESNLIEADILQKRGTTMILRSRSGYVFQAESRSAPSEDHVTVLVRPERVVLHESASDATASTIVVSSLFLGEMLRIEVEMAGGERLLIRCPDAPGRSLPPVGSRLHVSWGAEDCWVLS